MNPRLKHGLYAITDCKNIDSEEMLRRTEAILQTGISVLQYRDKNADQALKRFRGTALKKLCAKYSTPFLINDDVQLAMEIGTDGVHIGNDDTDYHVSRKLLGENAIIGISCYNEFARAILAEQMGADYVAFGAFFPSPSKDKTVKAETRLLQQAKTALDIPVVAIGGINPENGAALVEAGADMLAVISSIYNNPEPQATVLEFNQLFQEHT